MTVTTTLYTNHHVTIPGAEIDVRMTLNDAGQGNLTVMRGDQQVAAFPAHQIGVLQLLLAEAGSTLDAMRLNGADLMLEEPVGAEPSDVHELPADER